MIQVSRTIQGMRRRIKKSNKNLGSLNCITLLLSSGNRTMEIFLKAKAYSHFFG
jgi:hypothetical protein